MASLRSTDTTSGIPCRCAFNTLYIRLEIVATARVRDEPKKQRVCSKTVSFDSVEVLTKAIEDSVVCIRYEQIRNEQLDVVMKFFEGNDLFVSLPTCSALGICMCLSHGKHSYS